MCAFSPICKGYVEGVWFYESGSLLTLEAGKVGERWYYENGQLIGPLGFEESMWFRPDGNILMFGPKLDAEFLKDAPSVLAHVEDWLQLDTPDPTYSKMWLRKGR